MAVIIALVRLGQSVLQGAFHPLLRCFCTDVLVLMVNRFVACRHLTTTTLRLRQDRAQRYARLFLSTPLLYQDWDTYNQSHVREHHNIRVLCSDEDPDQRFIRAQGFYPGMPETAYWLRVCCTPFRPAYLLRQWRETWLDCFVVLTAAQRCLLVLLGVFGVLWARRYLLR